MRNNNTRMISDPCLTIPADARGSHAYLAEKDSIDIVSMALDFAQLWNWFRMCLNAEMSYVGCLLTSRDCLGRQVSFAGHFEKSFTDFGNLEYQFYVTWIEKRFQTRSRRDKESWDPPSENTFCRHEGWNVEIAAIWSSKINKLSDAISRPMSTHSLRQLSSEEKEIIMLNWVALYSVIVILKLSYKMLRAVEIQYWVEVRGALPEAVYAKRAAW